MRPVFLFIVIFLNGVAWDLYTSDLSATFLSKLARQAIPFEMTLLFLFVLLTYADDARLFGFEKFAEVLVLLLFVPVIVLTYAIAYGAYPKDPNWDSAGIWLTGDHRLYLSVVTFTTLGYGDVAIKPGQELFAASQAVLGFLFVPFIFFQAARLQK